MQLDIFNVVKWGLIFRAIIATKDASLFNSNFGHRYNVFSLNIQGNAKESAAKSIAKAHCCLTWLGKLSIAKKRGNLTPSELIKEWNSTCSTWAKLQGQKYTSLLGLLSLDEQAVELLLAHLNEFGSAGSAFTETIWANKKILPGGGPRGYPREWNQRLHMTSEGFIVMLRYIDATHHRSLEGARSKASVSEMEEAAMMSQLLVSLVGEVMLDHPIPKDILDKKLIDRFLGGDMTFELELQGALSQKISNFKATDLPSVRDIVAAHGKDKDQSLKSLGITGKIQPAQLERQEFDISMASVKHDLDLLKVWLTRSRDRESQRYHQELQWRLGRQSQAKNIADNMMSRSSEHWRCEIGHIANASQARTLIIDCQKQICKAEQILPENVVTVVLLNWAAPNLFTSQLQKDQANLMGSLLNSPTSPKALGLFLMPTFCFEKGMLSQNVNIYFFVCNGYVIRFFSIIFFR